MSATRFTTIELKINFLRPVWKAMLRTEARVVRGGKSVGLIECDIFDERQRRWSRARRAPVWRCGAGSQEDASYG